MSAFSNQPVNNNFLSPLGFKFTIKKTPLINYFVQAIDLPTITLSNFEIPTPFVKIPMPGTGLDFGQFNVTFKVDEDMKNYLEIYNWLIALGFPDEFQQYANLAAQLPGSGDGIFSDCTLMVLSSAMNPNKEIVFLDCFPVAISNVVFDSREQDVNYVEATATFACRKFVINNL